MTRIALAAVATALLGLASLSTPSLRAEGPTSQPAAGSANYPLDVCVISGEKLDGHDGQTIVKTIEGREVHFCCPHCVEAFEKDPAAGNAKMDKLIVEKQKAAYPLKTCPVSGEQLGGDMGEPVMFVDHKTNRLIELCCKSCLKEVQKDATAALAKIDAAAAAAK